MATTMASRSAITAMMIPNTMPRATRTRGRTTRSWTAPTTSSMVSATLAGHSGCESAGSAVTDEPAPVDEVADWFVAWSSMEGRLVAEAHGPVWRAGLEGED